MNRIEILEKGIALTTGDRAEAYGSFYFNMEMMAELLNLALRKKLAHNHLFTPMDCAMIMQLSKLAREIANPNHPQAHVDNAVDGCVYWAARYEIQAEYDVRHTLEEGHNGRQY